MNAKKTLSHWIAGGDLERAMHGLELVQDKQGMKQDDDFVLQKSRYNALKSSLLHGTISQADYLLELAKIRQAVLDMVNHLAEHWSAEGLETIPPSEVKSTSGAAKEDNRAAGIWKKIGYVGLLLGILAGMVKIIEYCGKPSNAGGDSMQLTVYVQDTAGKPVPELQNTGHVKVVFGDDLRYPVIGENGRSNIGEIPVKFRGQEIEVVLVAEGYEPVSAGKKYIMDGNKVVLNVQRDNSLGLIQGIVKDRSGERFIAGALVMIDQETTLTTDSLGRFKTVLPIDKQRETYAITVKKEGFMVKDDYYKPKSGKIEIRLDKK